MKDNRYYELRELTELIFRMRQDLMYMSKYAFGYRELEEKYNELCRKREALEKEYFKDINVDE